LAASAIIIPPCRESRASLPGEKKGKRRGHDPLFGRFRHYHSAMPRIPRVAPGGKEGEKKGTRPFIWPLPPLSFRHAANPARRSRGKRRGKEGDTTLYLAASAIIFPPCRESRASL